MKRSILISLLLVGVLVGRVGAEESFEYRGVKIVHGSRTNPNGGVYSPRISSWNVSYGEFDVNSQKYPMGCYFYGHWPQADFACETKEQAKNCVDILKDKPKK